MNKLSFIDRMNLYFKVGAFLCIDFTDEELIFSALHHDLGKLGTKGELHYVANDSDWHIKNRGEYFKRNEENTYMTLTDRTFFLLNLYDLRKCYPNHLLRIMQY